MDYYILNSLGSIVDKFSAVDEQAALLMYAAKKDVSYSLLCDMGYTVKEVY